MRRIEALEVSDEELRAKECLRVEIGVDSTSNHNINSVRSQFHRRNNTTIGLQHQSFPPLVPQSSTTKKAKLAKLVRQLRSPETPEEKIAAARFVLQSGSSQNHSVIVRKTTKRVEGAKRKAR
ncbi:hypothetical protein QTG54_016997 [Skeletonema marinoi]|uniref:Uncharacterized protein n=1 Tax=Skeletonema marinoi TaxID=267567 RepID=A0AAD9D476_9STRA|nr:hypothetical protein QTG54_016997 [Skeletonema marinoi]